METVQGGIETADEALTLYDSVLDRIIPWDEFNATLAELDKYRTEYSVETSTLVGEVKTLIMNGIDAYFSASRNVYEWCGSVSFGLNLHPVTVCSMILIRICFVDRSCNPTFTCLHYAVRKKFA